MFCFQSCSVDCESGELQVQACQHVVTHVHLCESPVRSELQTCQHATVQSSGPSLLLLKGSRVKVFSRPPTQNRGGVPDVPPLFRTWGVPGHLTSVGECGMCRLFSGPGTFQVISRVSCHLCEQSGYPMRPMWKRSLASVCC